MKTLRNRTFNLKRGALLLEASIGIMLLGIVGTMVLRTTLSAMRAQNWTVMQTYTDAYMTFEVALANRIPVNDFLDPASIYPLSADTANFVFAPAAAPVDPTTGLAPNQVVLGSKVGGENIIGTIRRTRFDLSDPNFAFTGQQSWALQSVLQYRVNGRTYVKSRQVIRTL